MRDSIGIRDYVLVALKIMVLFWLSTLLRHITFGVPKWDPNLGTTHDKDM